MMILHYIILCALSTAVASAAYGGDYGKKPYVIGLHMLVAPFVAPIFWVIFRRHRQAKAELDLFDTPTPDYAPVVSAYYIWPLGKIMARVMRYCMKNPWPHLAEKPARIQQELCGGFVLGAILAIPSAIIWGVYAAS